MAPECDFDLRRSNNVDITILARFDRCRSQVERQHVINRLKPRGFVMSNHIIDRLFTSFEDLEHAIISAKRTLLQKGNVPDSVLQRLSSYDGILDRQRALARDLCGHINNNNWTEVNRHVSLINGLSAMIRDDARAILSSLALNSDAASAEDEQNFC